MKLSELVIGDILFKDQLELWLIVDIQWQNDVKNISKINITWLNLLENTPHSGGVFDYELDTHLWHVMTINDNKIIS